MTRSTHLLRLIAALVGATTLVACPTEDNVDCTTIAVSSVVATVTDTDGNLLESAVVVWSNDSVTDEPCEASGGQFICGWEVSGEMTIDASQDAHFDGSETVTVGADECHVITEEVTVQLEPIPAPG